MQENTVNPEMLCMGKILLIVKFEIFFSFAKFIIRDTKSEKKYSLNYDMKTFGNIFPQELFPLDHCVRQKSQNFTSVIQISKFTVYLVLILMSAVENRYQY